ncbi:MAG: hypothetical protein JWP85_823 [Rhodoglobus sp.]|nr:hypothetical protein [Rhodoglobus sp.]
MLRTIDYAPLTAPVSRQEVTAFRQQARADPRYAALGGVLQVVVLVFGLGIGLFVVLTAIATILPALATTDGGAGLVFALFPLGFLAVLVLIVLLVVRSFFGQGGRWEKWLRLTRFGEANGLDFSPADSDPQYPGAIFGLGRGRTALDHLRSAADRFFDYGNYRYVTGSGKNSTTHNWGFMALSLDRALPHMVLDSRANNGLFGGTNLPATFTKDQVLQLEGDFNEHFTLYCPKQYERDALYVFTPDLMALLIDEAAPYDVEIIDKWMFVYSAAAFDLRQPAVHHRLLRIVDTVGAKTLTQTDRYADERVGSFAANIVAPEGQRLKRGISVGAIVIGIAVALFWIGPTIIDAIMLLFSR